MDHSREDEYRIALIRFEGKSCNIGTYWVSKDKFALVAAALGTPEVDSVYKREDVESNNIDGVHYYMEEDEEDAG